MTQIPQGPFGFESMSLRGWRQYDEVDLDFHPKLTVITGANAAGKTTILNLLASHFGWSTAFVATPTKRSRAGGVRGFLSGLWTARRPSSNEHAYQTVGTIEYARGGECTLVVQTEVGGPAFGLDYRGQAPVQGIFIPSHRPTFSYHHVAQIPTHPPTREQINALYLNEIRIRYAGSHSASSPVHRLKESLISLATFGEGNRSVEANPEALALYNGFIEVLRTVLPPTLGFQGISIRLPEVVLETESGDFPLDAVSGGVASIIDLAFQIFMGGPSGEGFVVILDEPENHLHPELQRALLPSFLSAFPSVQFIVATHNPFIIGSVRESNVYALQYHRVVDPDEPDRVRRRVSSLRLDTADKAGSSNEILMDVLGVPGTRGLWVENELQQILAKYRERVLDESVLREMQSDFSRLGLEESFPREASRLLKDKK